MAEIPVVLILSICPRIQPFLFSAKPAFAFVSINTPKPAGRIWFSRKGTSETGQRLSGARTFIVCHDTASFSSPGLGNKESRRHNRFGRSNGSPGKILPAGYDPGNIQIRRFPAVVPVLYPGEGCAAVQLPALMRRALLPGPAVSKG